jgi:hypothetical protein
MKISKLDKNYLLEKVNTWKDLLKIIIFSLSERYVTINNEEPNKQFKYLLFNTFISEEEGKNREILALKRYGN